MRRHRRVQTATSLAVVIAALLVFAAPASAGGTIRTKKLYVTYVARECPTYDSIRANRARNNILESLKDLGPDSDDAAGEALTAEREARPPQDACQPITNWKFTLGTGIQSRADVGEWGALSRVTDAFGTSIVTKSSTALLNDQGQKTGKDIAGAVTVKLTSDQADLAAASSRLWVQGGVPGDPVLDQVFPSVYGFGALRCAIDNLNGDNVEWIAYPTGAKHVFCFAYYVKPPPTAGKIIVRKEVDPSTPPNQPVQAFPFQGNISYAPGGAFHLDAGPGSPGEVSFFRAGGTTWDFTEHVPAGWQLTAITCTSASSAVRTDVATGRTEVDLRAGDTVTCTYSDRIPPLVAGLHLRKISRGGTGNFDFSVEPSGGGDAQTARATTTEPGVATDAAPSFDALAPGDYDVTEKLPDSDRGSWALTGVICNDADRSTDNPIRVTLAAGSSATCTYENRFTPKGTIRLRKNTLGGTGTTGFVINSIGTDPPRQYEQAATTTAENTAARAQGDDTGNVLLGAYEITETGPSSGSGREWRVDGALCDGVAVPVAQGSIRIGLTEAHPDVDCTFYNERQKPTVLPSAATGGGAQSTPRADLVVRKHPARRVIRLGQTVRYFVTVRNRGRATARNVTLVEQVGDRRALLAATPKRYRCSATARRLPGCLLGTIRPDQTVRITVYVRPRFTGRRPNRAVVNTSTAELNRRNNVARSAVFVRPRPRFTG